MSDTVPAISVTSVAAIPLNWHHKSDSVKIRLNFVKDEKIEVHIFDSPCNLTDKTE